MSSYIDQLERELMRAGSAYYRQLAPSKRPAMPRWPRLRIGDIGPVLGVGVAVVIAGLAIVLLGRSGHNRSASNQPTAPAGAQALVSDLAVLRRAQTAADRLSPSVSSRLELNDGPLVDGLTRVVSVDGMRFYLIVSHPTERYMRSQFTRFSLVANGPWWNPASGDLIALTRGPMFLPQLPVPVGELRDPQASAVWIVTTGQQRYLAEIVPDGVVRVRVSFPQRTVIATVHDNVAIIRAPATDRSEAVRSIAWEGLNGAVIPTITPPHDALRKAALSARLTGIRAIFTQQAAAIPNHAPAAIIRNFKTFTTPAERSVSANGVTITHPPLSALPLTMLQEILNPRAAREITTQSGLRFWADPGPLRVHTGGPGDQVRQSTQICLRQASSPSAGNCVSNLTRALQQGVWATTSIRAGPVIYGIVPNTNTTIAVHLADRATRTVTVANGVAITPAAGASAISVHGSDGTLRTIPTARLTRYGG